MALVQTVQRKMRGLASAVAALGGRSATAGRCDGLVGTALCGWAWKRSAPGERVIVELWVDGQRESEAVADLFRPDLQANGVGDGRYGWRLRLWRRAGPGLSKVEVRVKDGGPLPGGVLELALDAEMFGEPEPAAGSETVQPVESPTFGQCDGVEGGMLKGWAWRPDFPEGHVRVEQLIDGVVVANTLADLPRGDLAGANIGHSRYGWRMPLALDRSKKAQQLVEVRVVGGALLEGGRLWLKHDPDAPEDATGSSTTDETAAEDRIIGFYDGLKGSALHGWAWNPAHPDQTIVVELLVDGVVTAEVVSDGFRPDLRANGVGHGRYGWRLPVERDPARTTPLKIEIRPKGGAPLPNGVFDLRNDLSLDDPANAELRPFVLAVLNSERRASAGGRLPMPKTALLVHCPLPRGGGEFWAREYDDYRAAMACFAPVLRTLGDVIEVASVEEANKACVERRKKGEACILFSFGSPRLAPLDAACPVIPVFGWSFPSIPTGMWDGDRRSDWRYVFRTTGRAIALSRFAAQAVKAAMGPDYAVAVVPVPTAGRTAPIAIAPPSESREILIKGLVLDSRDYVFDPNDTGLPSPEWRGDDAGLRGRTSVHVTGVLFTAILDLKDGRENWHDLITAFAAAHAGNPDATLLVRLSETNPRWWEEVYKWLRLAPRFTCRFIFMRGEMDAGEHAALIAASHWYVNVPKAAGLRIRLQEFLSAGRPAVSVAHTAMADYVSADNALIVDADEEPWTWADDSEGEGWSWTQHPADVGFTSRYRISWTSMMAALAEAYRISAADPARYAGLAANAAATMRAFCADAVVADKVEAFIGPGSPSAQAALGPSALLREPPP